MKLSRSLLVVLSAFAPFVASAVPAPALDSRSAQSALVEWGVAPGAIAIGAGAYVENNASGGVAIGTEAIAVGLYSSAIGSGTSFGTRSFSAAGGESRGDHSTALGQGAWTRIAHGVALGRYNDAKTKSGSTSVTTGPEVPVFEVGIGTSGVDRRNALTIYADGEIRIHEPQGDILMGEFGP